MVLAFDTLDPYQVPYPFIIFNYWTPSVSRFCKGDTMDGLDNDQSWKCAILERVKTDKIYTPDGLIQVCRRLLQLVFLFLSNSIYIRTRNIVKISIEGRFTGN